MSAAAAALLLLCRMLLGRIGRMLLGRILLPEGREAALLRRCEAALLRRVTLLLDVAARLLSAPLLRQETLELSPTSPLDPVHTVRRGWGLGGKG